MSTLPPAVDTNAEVTPEFPQKVSYDDVPHNGKGGSLDPDLLPARNSSLKPSTKRSDSPKFSKQFPQDENGSGFQGSTTPSPIRDKPPTPPPKNIDRNNSMSRPPPKLPTATTPKRTFLEALLVALLTCCSPKSNLEHETKSRQRSNRQTIQTKPIEMDSLKKDDDRPTTSTIGGPSVDEEQPAVVVSAVAATSAPPPSTSITPKKAELPVEIPKQSVTIFSDEPPEKEPTPYVEVIPQPPEPVDDEFEDEYHPLPNEDEITREREMRHSMQLQAPFPPITDTVRSEALVVSPSSQVSVQGNAESEDSEVDEIPKPVNTMFDEPQPKGPFLGPVPERKKGKKCLVLDLDECLIHSTFVYNVLIVQDTKHYDFSIALNLERDYGLSYIYVGKRPHLDRFLEAVGDLYEIVIFTASLQRYADPVVDIIDRNRVIDHRLFRDSCTRTWDPVQRIFLPNVKNLSLLGRDLKKCIIIDNNPQCYQWHQEHAVPISSWFEDTLDAELLTMIPLLKDLAKDEIEDVRDILSQEYPFPTVS